MTSYTVNDLPKEISQSQELLQTTEILTEEAPRTATIYEVLKQCCLANHRNTQKCSHCESGFEIRRMYQLLDEELPRWKNQEKHEALAYWQNKGRIILRGGGSKYWHFDFSTNADQSISCPVMQKGKGVKRVADRDKNTISKVSHDHSFPMAMTPPSVKNRYLLECVLEQIRQDKETLLKSVVEHNLRIREIGQRFSDVVDDKDQAELARCKIL